MDITTIMAVVFSAGVILAWFVLPGSKAAEIETPAAAPEVPILGEPVSLTA